MQAPSNERPLPRLAGMPRPLGLGLIAALEAGCALLDWRFSRAWPVSHLYYLPIALAGALFGFAAAIPAALASAAIFVSIDFRYLGRVPHEPDVIRLVLFLAVGLVASMLRRDSQRLRTA